METIQTYEKGKRFLITSQKTIRIITEQDIMYVRAEGNYSVFIMFDKSEWTLCQTLEHVENSLNQGTFYRCHRSFLVNLSMIREISRRIPVLVLVDDARLPIARRKRSAFLKSLYETKRNYLSQ